LTFPQLAPPQAVGKIRQCVALGLAASKPAGWRKTSANCPFTGRKPSAATGLFVEDWGRAARSYVVSHAGKTTYCHRTPI
jgi:hypothetical protein